MLVVLALIPERLRCWSRGMARLLTPIPAFMSLNIRRINKMVFYPESHGHFRVMWLCVNGNADWFSIFVTASAVRFSESIKFLLTGSAVILQPHIWGYAKTKKKTNNLFSYLKDEMQIWQQNEGEDWERPSFDTAGDWHRRMNKPNVKIEQRCIWYSV